MADVTRPASKLERLLGLAILLLLLVGSFAVILPFLSALAWAFVMAFSLWPAHRRLAARLRQRRTLAAIIMTSAIALVLVVPTAVAVVNLTDDARALASSGRRWLADAPQGSPQWVRKLPIIGHRAAAHWEKFARDSVQLLEDAKRSAQEEPLDAPPSPSTAQTVTQDNSLSKLLGGLMAWARRWAPVAALAIVNGLTQVLLSVFLTFFIFRDGAAVAQRLEISIRRAAGPPGLHLLHVAGSTVRSVVYGILGTALVQGIMAGIGFLIAGVPGAALLGLVTFCLSPLPLGPPLVWIPVTLWLFQQGRTGWGFFVLAWGLAISSVDNIVKPWIISRGNRTPFILVLFGVIGGALAFGFIGVFLGPTLLAVAYTMLEQWSRESVSAEPMPGEPGTEAATPTAADDTAVAQGAS